MAGAVALPAGRCPAPSAHSLRADMKEGEEAKIVPRVPMSLVPLSDAEKVMIGQLADHVTDMPDTLQKTLSRGSRANLSRLRHRMRTHPPIAPAPQASDTALMSAKGVVYGNRSDFKMNTSIVHDSGALLLGAEDLQFVDQSFRMPEGRSLLQSSRASHAVAGMGMDGISEMGDPLQMDYESDGCAGDFEPPGFDEPDNLGALGGGVA